MRQFVSKQTKNPHPQTENQHEYSPLKQSESETVPTWMLSTKTERERNSANMHALH